MAAILEREGLSDQISIDSAGTAAWHEGKGPDARSVAAAAARGLRIAGRARPVTERDFSDFDLLLAADEQNVSDLQAMAPPGTAAEKIVLLRSFDRNADAPSVPDPYHGEADGFDHVLDVVEAACEGLVTHLRETGRVP
jgi:protein-tyrosine phosphatase